MTKVYTKVAHKCVELGDLVNFGVSKNKDGFRSEFYLNDDNKIVWDLFDMSRSNENPVSTIVYEVVQG